MERMLLIICYAISFLLVLESVVGENAKIAENDGVPLSDSNATSLNITMMTPNYEENADENSTAPSSAISTNPALANSSTSTQSNYSAVNEHLSTSLDYGNQNSSKSSSILSHGRSVNSSVSNETSAINSTEYVSQGIQSTTTHNNGEPSSEVSAVTTSSASTTALSKSSSSLTTDASEGGGALKDMTKDGESESRARLLVAVVKTLVTTSISSSTTVVFSTCITGAVPTNACARKRKKRRQLLLIPQAGEQYLDSSVQDPSFMDPSLKEAKPLVPARRAGRLIIWSSSVQTVTFIATSTDPATVISVSFFCSFSGIPATC